MGRDLQTLPSEKQSDCGAIIEARLTNQIRRPIFS
jgi:hypothetical protein